MKKEMKISTIGAALVIAGSVLRAAYGVTPEETDALCALTSSFCSSCRSPCSKNYYKWGRTRYSSGCGEYCDEINGTITRIELKPSTKLTSLSAEIGKFTDLVFLDLSSNSLTTLPYSLRSLKSLTDLYDNLFSLSKSPFFNVFYNRFQFLLGTWLTTNCRPSQISLGA